MNESELPPGLTVFLAENPSGLHTLPKIPARRYTDSFIESVKIVFPKHKVLHQALELGLVVVGDILNHETLIWPDEVTGAIRPGQQAMRIGQLLESAQRKAKYRALLAEWYKDQFLRPPRGLDLVL